MTPAPREYADWVPLIDAFGSGDDAAIEIMGHGSFHESTDVTDRFAARVNDAFMKRVERMRKALQRDLDNAHGDPVLAGRALVAARRAIQPIACFADLTPLPQRIRDFLGAELQRIVTGIQTSLETSARSSRNTELLRCITATPLRSTVSSGTAPRQPTQPPTDADAPPQNPSRKRSIIF